MIPDFKRYEAMNWWKTLSSAEKTRYCDLNTEIIGTIRRHESLTGREIELIYDKKEEL